VFSGKGCGDLKNTDSATVTGTKNPDTGVVTATKVESTAPAPITVTGTISGLMGSCPTIKFSLGEKTVYTSSSTVFSGKGCADLKNTDSASVTGMKNPDTGVVTASKVETTKSPAARRSAP
jgi:hypothetical protein